ncbi:hypothetical protein G6F51_014646 [Rhizopus arrhizus]|uniref:Uncharacterized protein n=1 Tax=Rhizopus oryzae TaxID=64495 RepID=A0A9P7BYD1_RHIOR|nr:hypothetical protein G6F51_014646 [Rhizopus arrhizus]
MRSSNETSALKAKLMLEHVLWQTPKPMMLGSPRLQLAIQITSLQQIMLLLVIQLPAIPPRAIQSRLLQAKEKVH